MAKVKGIWVFHSIQTAAEGASGLSQAVNFTSNGIAFDRMLLLGDYTSAMTYSNIEDSYSVYTHSGGWVNESFRIVDFGEQEQTVTDEWYARFTANAAPASTPDEPDEPMTGEYYAIKKSTLEGIGNAVRSKTGKSGKIPVVSLAAEIEGISVGKTLKKFDGTVVIE